MAARNFKHWYIIYPEYRFKDPWDLFIGLVLIITCSVTPVHIAFYEDEKDIGGFIYVNYLFDTLFAIDLIVQFVSAYYDEDYYLIDDIRIISFNYVRSWFFIDITAIFPFQVLNSSSAGSSDASSVIRIARVGRMWRLVKLTRLIRIFKIVK